MYIAKLCTAQVVHEALRFCKLSGLVWMFRLVDHMGGIDNAVALVKEAAEIPADEQVR